MGAGKLEVAIELLAEAIGLPKDVEIEAIDYSPLRRSVELLVAGPSLPPRPAAGGAEQVTLIYHRSVRLVGSWAHAPEIRWQIQE